MKKFTFNAVKTVLFLTTVGIIITLFALFSLAIDKHDEVFVNADYYVSQRSGTVIVIDPGHGGEDGGAVANGIVEKDINLAISKLLESYLKLSGYSCALTRTEDVLLYNPGEENSKKRHDLLNRVSFANNYEDVVFVSIHQNKFEIPKYKGLQVYYSPNNQNSGMLASVIQRNARSFLDNNNDREIKQSDFRIKVLDMLKMPAVLVECGFISNYDEAEMLKTKEYQCKTAFTIYISIMEYFENNA